MASFSPLRRVLVGTSLAAAALVCACGARGPLDITVIVEGPDTGADVAVPLDAPSDQTEAGDATDASPDVKDAVPETSMGMEASPIATCATCLTSTCGGQLLACVTSPPCAAGLQCLPSCLTGGTPNIQCLLGCGGGNQMAQQQLLAVVACVVGNCSSCLGVLGGLGGGGGGG